MPHYLQTEIHATFLSNFFFYYYFLHLPGTQTAACVLFGFFPLFRNKSSTHLLMWAIHSCFSEFVAAYTAKLFVAVRITHPFLYCALSSSACNWTSSNGMICCLLYFFLPITIFPYTRMSLKRKNCRGFARLRHIFVNTPSPTYKKKETNMNKNTHFLDNNKHKWKKKKKFFLKYCFVWSTKK